MFRLLQITSAGATFTLLDAIRYGMWCVSTCAAICAAICWWNKTNAELSGGYVCSMCASSPFAAALDLLTVGERTFGDDEDAATSRASVRRASRRAAFDSASSSRAQSIESTFFPISGSENGIQLATGRRCVGRFFRGTSFSASDTSRSASTVVGLPDVSGRLVSSDARLSPRFASFLSFFLCSPTAVFTRVVSADSSFAAAACRRSNMSGISLRSRLSQTLATPPGR